MFPEASAMQVTNPPTYDVSRIGISLSERAPLQPSKRGAFGEVLNGVRDAAAQSSDIYRSLEEVRNSVMQGKAFSVKEVLVFQIRAAQFGLQVELISKAVESGLCALRKLQVSQ